MSLPAAAAVSQNEVAGRLESAGISVRLPELPRATTPASILFAASTPTTISGTGFGWLNTPPGGTPQIGPAAPAASSAEQGPDGLPKRVPKGQLLAPPVRPQPSSTAKRDAARARGFLSGFQSGVRRGETES
jgi:hypothetical protein